MTEQLRNASPPLLMHYDTDEVAAGNRFDYWREVHPSVDMTSLKAGGVGRAFQGSVRNLVSPDNTTVLSRTVSDGTASRFKDNARNNVILGTLTAGDVKLPGADDRDCVRPGALYMLDLHSSEVFETHGFENVFLSMPREQVATILGADLTPATGVRILPDLPLGRILQSHLVASGRELDRLPGSVRASVLDTSRSLARAVLAQVADTDAAAAASEADMVKAARRCMAGLLDRPDLTAGALAQVMGCSRSRLYRAFDSCEVGVMETLSEMRMDKARSLLALTQMPVGEVALACGYTDVSAFARAFRRAFQVSPSEYRIAHPR